MGPGSCLGFSGVKSSSPLESAHVGTAGRRGLSGSGDLSTGTALRLGQGLGGRKHGVAFHNSFKCKSSSDSRCTRSRAHCCRVGGCLKKSSVRRHGRCVAVPAGGCGCATRFACDRPVTQTAFLRFDCEFRCGGDGDSGSACSLKCP